MRFLKNKHFVMALLIAPVLAVAAYFATDQVVSEPPRLAKTGQSYKLAARSNCRYQSGICTLKNGDVEVHLQADRVDEHRVTLSLNSALTIQKALISVATEENTPTPEAMTGPLAENQWQLQVEIDRPEKSTMRLALSIAGATYYAEIPAVFVDYETSFSRENFSPGKG